jgi:hypothetical protein
LTLRDGVLLCNLVHFLDPTMDAIEFNRKPRDAQVWMTSLNVKRVNFIFISSASVSVLAKHSNIPGMLSQHLSAQRERALRVRNAVRLDKLSSSANNAVGALADPQSAE